MKYNEPYGSTDPNAGYIDRNTPGAVAGSRVPAAAIEHPQREIMAVITAAGLEPSKTDLTQLLKAIQQIVNAATGGAGDPNYVLMTQARVRLPIFPEVSTSDGKLAVISPSAGIVRLMPGYDFVHRGIYAVTTVQQDFVTAANKVYHLRWNQTDGFVLRDLSNAGYNPGGLAEASSAFDSTYDDMLIAKVVTNASNVPTITTLSNKNVLALSERIAVPTANRQDVTNTFNWARSPKNYTLDILGISGSNGADYWFMNSLGTYPGGVASTAFDIDRYRVSQTFAIEASYSVIFQFNARG